MSLNRQQLIDLLNQVDEIEETSSTRDLFRARDRLKRELEFFSKYEKYETFDNLRDILLYLRSVAFTAGHDQLVKSVDNFLSPLLPKPPSSKKMKKQSIEEPDSDFVLVSSEEVGPEKRLNSLNSIFVNISA